MFQIYVERKWLQRFDILPSRAKSQRKSRHQRGLASGIGTDTSNFRNSSIIRHIGIFSTKLY